MKPSAALAAGLAIVAAGAGGFLAWRLGPGQPGPGGRLVAASAPVGAPSAGTPTPSDPAAPSTAATPPAPPPIPDRVPDLTLPDLDGKPQPLRATDGRPRLYNFWATWCEPCRREIPLLNTLESRYKADGLAVVGVAIDFRDAVQAYLAKQPIHYALRVGEEDGVAAAQAFGVEMALPFSVFADGEGRVIAVKVGELHADDADAIMARMRQIRSGGLTPAAGRQAIADDLQALSVKRAKQKKPE